MLNKSIFLVDDDYDIRSIVTSVLEDSGYEVTQASNGLEALEKLRKLEDSQIPGLIILDLQMPIMDGESFLEALPHEAKSLQKVPVVVFSARGSFSNLSEIIRSKEHMKKPMDLDDLFSMVERHCGAGA